MRRFKPMPEAKEQRAKSKESNIIRVWPLMRACETKVVCE